LVNQPEFAPNVRQQQNALRDPMGDEMDIEEDFAALRDSFTSLRASIQQELMSRTDPAGGFSMPAAPVQRPVVGPGMPGGIPSPIHPVGEEAMHHGQFSALREQLMGGWAASSACSSTPHVPSRITSSKPTQPLPPGMGYEVRASPAKVGGAHEGRRTAPPPAPKMVSVERTSADTVVLNAPKPGRSGGASLLAATETALFSGPARAQAAQPYKQEDSAADVAKQYRVRAEVLRSATSTVASGQRLSGGDSVVFGHLAMRAALESHRRHYAEARAAHRPDGSKLQPAAQMQPTSVPGPRSARKATEPRGPSLATADRSRMVRSAFGSTVTPFVAGGGSNSPSALPPGCEASTAAASVLAQEELSRLHDRIGAQRASMSPRAASAGSCSAPRAPLSARPSSAKGKQRTVPLIAATAR
jgi:hypothetical protein